MLDLRVLSDRDTLMSRLRQDPGSNIRETVYTTTCPVVSLSILVNGMYILNAEATSILMDARVKRCYLLECGEYTGYLACPYLQTVSEGVSMLHFSFVGLRTEQVQYHAIPWPG